MTDESGDGDDEHGQAPAPGPVADARAVIREANRARRTMD